MSDLPAQNDRTSATHRVVTFRVARTALDRLRALVRVTPCTRLDQAVEDALAQSVATYVHGSEQFEVTMPVVGRDASAVLPVRLATSIAETVRALVDSRPGLSLSAFVTSALTAWCDSHPLAAQQHAIPRDLRRGGRRRTVRVPRDFIVIVDDA